MRTLIAFWSIIMIVTPVAGQTQSQWVDGAPDDFWSSPENWAPAEVPNNGTDTYEVTADGAAIVLDIAATIDKLTLNLTSGTGVSIFGSGQSLTVEGPTIVDLGFFHGSGTFEPEGAVDIGRTLYLSGEWNMTASDILLGTGVSSAEIVLDGSAMLENTGTLELLNDSNVTNFGTTETLLKNSDLMLKSAGTGQSVVSVPFENNGGTVQVASGTLAFTNRSTLSGGSIEVAGNGTARLNGNISAGGSVALSARNTGEIIFGNAVIDSAATFTGAGDPTANIKATGTGTRISKATFTFAPETPMQFRRSTLGEMGQVINNGFANLYAATLKGGGLMNDGAGDLSIVPGEAGTTTIDATELLNQGIVHQLTNCQLKTDGKITNNGTWRIEGGLSNVNLATGATSTGFTNASQLVVLLPSSSNDAIIHVPFESPGVINVRNGELKIHKPELDGTVINVDPSDPQATYQAECSIGLNGASSGSLKNVNFLLTEASEARFLAGTFFISDLIACSGMGTLTNLATLVASQPARIESGQNSPFVMRGTLQADAMVENVGVIEWHSGTLRGGNELRNNATVLVEGVMGLSENGVTGTFGNRGVVLFDAATAAIFDDNGTFRNDPGGALGLDSNANLLAAPGASNQLLDNAGTISKFNAGGAEIQIPFKQTAGTTDALDGRLTLKGSSNDLLGGTLAAIGANAVIQIEGPSNSDGVELEFENGADIVYQGTGVLHEVAGNLHGTGNGQAILRSATMRAKNGGSAEFEFVNSSAFRVESGTLGAATELLKNHGTLEHAGGDVVGLFSNEAFDGGTDPNVAGLYVFTGGRLQASFQNHGDFVWQDGGSIEGPFTNNAADGTAMTLAGDDALLLAAGATLTNNGEIEHTGGATLEMGEDAEIIIPTGANYTFKLLGGDIVRTGDAIEDAKLATSGTISQESNIGCNVSVKFESLGGTLDAVLGDLNINGVALPGGDPIINSGRLEASGGTLKLTFPQLFGSIVHDTNVAGVIRHVNPTVDTTVVGTGGGRIEFDQGTLNNLALILESGTTAAMQTLQKVGTAVTSTGGAVRFEGTEFRMFDGPNVGSFDANSDLAFAENFPFDRVQLTGPASGSRVPFNVRFGHTATLEDPADLVFQGAIEYINDGDFLLASRTGDLEYFDLGTSDVLFRNDGLFEKTMLENNVGSSSSVSIYFENNNTVRTRAGSLTIGPFCLTLDGDHLIGGAWVVDPDSSLTLNLDETILENDGEIVLRGNGVFTNLPNAGTTDTFQNDGTIYLQNGAQFTTGGEFENNGSLIVEPGSVLTAQTLDNDGDTVVNGTLNFSQSATFQSGCLRGGGIVNGVTINNAGCISPGNSPGMLTVNADILNTAGSSLEIELAGLMPGDEHDLLWVNGDVTLDGTLDVALLDNFMPGAGDTFTILSANTLTGTFVNAPADSNGFAVLDLPQGAFTIEYTADAVRLVDFSIPSDFDGDGMVDIADYGILAQCLAGPAASGPPTGCTAPQYFATDLDGDGDVDIADYSVFARSLGSMGAP